MNSHKFPLALATTLFLCLPTPCTEVAMIVWKNHVVMAADSLWRTPTGYVTKCKISHFGRFFWVGLGTAGNPSIRFDLNDIVIRSARKNLGTRETLEDAASALTGPLSKTFFMVKKRAESGSIPDARDYRELVKAGEILTLHLVGQEFSSLSFFKITFMINGQQIRKGPIVGCDFVEIQCVVIGGSPEAEAYLHSLHSDRSAHIVEDIDAMMQLGMRAQPDKIGPPVSILDIWPDHATWVRQNDCQDVKQPPTHN